MSVHGTIKPKDIAILELRDKDGNIKAIRICDMITGTGRQAMALAIGTTRGTPGASWIALGSSAALNQGTRTRLVGERAAPGSGGGPGRFYGSFVRPAGSFYFYRYRTWPAGSATGTLKEVGLFIQSTNNATALRNAGGMVNRGTFSLINKLSSDSLKCQINIQFGTN